MEELTTVFIFNSEFEVGVKLILKISRKSKEYDKEQEGSQNKPTFTHLEQVKQETLRAYVSRTKRTDIMIYFQLKQDGKASMFQCYMPFLVKNTME